MPTRLTYLLLVFSLLVTQTVHAAPTEDWTLVTQLPKGARIEVIYEKLKRVQGTYVAADDSTLRVSIAGAEKAIAKADVLRISTGKMSRANRTLLGAAIGAGTMLVITGIAAASGDIDIRHDLLFGATAALGAGVGAGAGAATGGMKTIYRAPARP